MTRKQFFTADKPLVMLSYFEPYTDVLKREVVGYDEADIAFKQLYNQYPNQLIGIHSNPKTIQLNKNIGNQKYGIRTD